MSAPNNEATFKPGDRIFIEGEFLSRAYVIKSGKVELSKRVGGDEQVCVCVVTQGGIVGEMALVDNNSAEVTARAMEPVTAIVIDRLTFERSSNKASPMVRSVLAALTSRLRDRTRDICNNTTIVC